MSLEKLTSDCHPHPTPTLGTLFLHLSLFSWRLGRWVWLGTPVSSILYFPHYIPVSHLID